ncbi:hypothetical protein [Syntrophobacter fumaroxidans]|nr:hypothetical protein [Syntrophobacter fumaroxidans]
MPSPTCVDYKFEIRMSKTGCFMREVGLLKWGLKTAAERQMTYNPV